MFPRKWEMNFQIYFDALHVSGIGCFLTMGRKHNLLTAGTIAALSEY
jgi:hypothetical protein